MRYRIEVRGELDARFGAALGFDVEPRHGSTVLIGDLTGRTNLRCLLGRLDDVGIEVVRVNALESTERSAESRS